MDSSSIHSRRRDQALVRSVLEGDPAAIEGFIQRMRCIPRFLRTLNARRGGFFSPEELDDLAQEVFARVWKRLDGFRGESEITSWVWRFCSLIFLARARDAARQSALRVEESYVPEAQTWDDHGRDERRAAVLAALEALPNDEQDVIVARHFDARTFREIAAAKGEPLGSQKTRYYRGIARLRAWMENAGFDGLSEVTP